MPQLVWLIWLGTVMQTERLPVRFPVTAHAWVAGLVSSWGVYRRQPMDVSVSHGCFFSFPSPSLPLSLKKFIYIDIYILIYIYLYIYILYSIMPSANNVYFFFSNWMLFLFCLITVSRTSNTLLNNNGEHGHLVLFLILQEKPLVVHCWVMRLAVGLLHIAFIMLR